MIELVVVVICLVINAVLAGAEMAFVTVPKPHLRQLAKTGDKNAQKVLTLRDNPERTLSVIQVGITLVGAIAAAVGGAGAEESISPYIQAWINVDENTAEFLSILLVVFPITFLSVVVGELVPKSVALRNPMQLILLNAKWLYLFDRVLSPIVSVLEKTTKWILKLVPNKKKADASANPPETIELDQLSTQTRQYIGNLVAIEKKRVRELYLPWEKVATVQPSQSLAEIEKVIVDSGHTRLPVVLENRVLGMINTKEFMSLLRAGKEDWYSIIRPVVHVKETDTLLKALKTIQEHRTHLGIVLSNEQIVGIVTMADILEEVIGDIWDEDDDGTVRKILSSGASFRGITRSPSR